MIRKKRVIQRVWGMKVLNRVRFALQHPTNARVTFAPSDAYPMRSGQQRLWDSTFAELPLVKINQHTYVSSTRRQHSDNA